MLDLRLQRVEESARSWGVLQSSAATVQIEVAVMKSTQMELFTMMQHMDKLLQRLVAKREQGASIGVEMGHCPRLLKEYKNKKPAVEAQEKLKNRLMESPLHRLRVPGSRPRPI